MVGSLAMTQLLIEHGAFLSLAPGYSLTPLNSAVVRDRPEVCRQLLTHRADPDEVNADGCSALQVRPVVSLLLFLKGDDTFTSCFAYC